MPKKGLNIHKRKDGRWEGRYQTRKAPDGATKYASVYGKTYSEAKNKLLCAMTEKDFSASKKNDYYFAEVLHLWLNNNRPRQKGATEHKYRTMIEKHIEPGLGTYTLSQLTSVVINSFLDKKLKSGRLDKKGGLSPSYVRTMSHIIQSAIQYAADEEFCQPLKSPICKPIANKRSVEILSKDEQHDLEAYLNHKSDIVCLGVMLSLYAGLRIGEICALQWNDIDLTAGVIHVRHTIARIRDVNDTEKKQTVLIMDTPKTQASARDIPIFSVLRTRLNDMKRSSSCGFVLSDTLSFVQPRTYEYRFHKLLSDSGIKQVNYHVLRHTFATRCIEAGVDVKSLSEMLGHANVGITLNTYVHSSMELKRSQLEKLQTESDF